MSGRAREVEDLPPAKRLRTEAEEKDGETVEGAEAKEEGMEQEDGADQEDQKTGKANDNWAMLSHMKEEDVGITEYISQHKGVSGVIKQRYSDFIVNEVSLSGEIIHLTNTDLPVVIEELEPSGPVDCVLPEEFLTQLKQVAAGSIPGHTASIPVGDDKEKRLHIHRAVKAAFPTLETKTEEKEGQKVITAMLKGKGKDNRKAVEWPRSKSKFPYCRFVMYKENKGTMDVVHLIARYLKVKDSVFHYAGTKDRRGKTTQEVTAYKVHPKKLQDLNKFLRNITLGNFRYVEKQLRLGELSGNRFTIVLRNLVGEDGDVERGLRSLQEVGFINYYGLQRFGTQSVCTHHVGRALLKEDWEEAVNLIIAGNNSENLAFRKIWLDTKDTKKTLEALENRHYIERVVLRSLLRRPTDFFGAVKCLPRNTRLIYPHSYQSMVWNTMASRRIATFGLKPMVGDLVLPPGAATDMDATDADNVEQVTEEEQDPKAKWVPRVKPVVLDETTVSKYSIYDVVLPLPGFDIIYPSNEVHSWYKEQLEKDGFDIENMQRKQKDYSLPGGYRAIVVRPTDMEWKMFRYNDTTAALALSDIDHMNGVEEPQSIEDGKLKAVRLTFTLSTSSYATMALREVLKTDTSPAQQASMNVT